MTDDGLSNDTLCRALLTFATDGPDALMYAALKGSEDPFDATRILTMLLRTTLAQPPLWINHRNERDGASPAFPDDDRQLDRLFIVGIARWGRRADARALENFHHAVRRWRDRLLRLPLADHAALTNMMTHGGEQWIVTPRCDHWPHQLTDLAIRSDWAPPLCLWGMGDPSSLVSCKSPVAVVGSRDVNDYGRFVARNAGLHAARDGHLLVSGGAMGADAAAHWGALAARRERDDTDEQDQAGRTVAVFAGGLDLRGPARNLSLFNEMLANRGALISEMPPGTIPEARRFLLRNRIIAALADVIIVAQARHRSGALNTATWAAEMNRKVYAAPGDIDEPFNTGCNRLIHDGKAILLHSATDISSCCHERHEPHDAGAAVTDAETSGDEAEVRDSPRSGHDDGGSMILTAIRSCARRHVAATADEISGYLATKPSTSALTFGEVIATLGRMEARGEIAMRDDGTVRIVR